MTLPIFSKSINIPGQSGNRMDHVLHGLMVIEKIPSPLFMLLLIAVSWVINSSDDISFMLFFGFCIIDWLLILFLPVFMISFGPSKPSVLILAFLRISFRFIPYPFNWIVQFFGTLLVVWGFYVEPQWLRVIDQELLSSKIDKGKSLRLVHLGDLHMERSTNRERIILSSIKSFSPDLILFTGDILNYSYLNDVYAHSEASTFLNSLGKIAPTYLVLGSPAIDIPDLTKDLLTHLPIHLVEDQVMEIAPNNKKIQIIGLSCSHIPNLDIDVLETLKFSPHLFTILMYHSPDLAPYAAELTGVDLQLSGHTHGGQFRLPLIGAILTGSLFGGKFQRGRYHIRDLTLYVSAGIGMEGMGAPRVRFLCRPEIIRWIIKSDL